MRFARRDADLADGREDPGRQRGGRPGLHDAAGLESHGQIGHHDTRGRNGSRRKLITGRSRLRRAPRRGECE
jgi:hypothetical protein